MIDTEKQDMSGLEYHAWIPELLGLEYHTWIPALLGFLLELCAFSIPIPSLKDYHVWKDFQSHRTLTPFIPLFFISSTPFYPAGEFFYCLFMCSMRISTALL